MTSLLSDANDIRLIQKQVVQYALTGLDELFLTIAGLPPEVARNILIESLPGVAATYGDISAVAFPKRLKPLTSSDSTNIPIGCRHSRE